MERLPRERIRAEIPATPGAGFRPPWAPTSYRLERVSRAPDVRLFKRARRVRAPYIFNDGRHLVTNAN
jgi:hypothetical protein